MENKKEIAKILNISLPFQCYTALWQFITLSGSDGSAQNLANNPTRCKIHSALNLTSMQLAHKIWGKFPANLLYNYIYKKIL